MTNFLIESANSAGERWAAWAGAVALDSAGLLVLISLVWLVIRGRVAPQVGYCLFLLVPLKLLMPVSLTVPAFMARWTPSVLVSSCFKGDHAPDRIERHPSVETRIAALRSEQSARSRRRFASTAQSAPVAASSREWKAPTEAPSSLEAASAAGVSTHAVAAAPRLSVPAMVMMAWVAGVLLLLGRLVRTELQFRARLQRASPVDESSLAVDFGELCRLAGVSQTIRVVESDCVAGPAVWGIAQPTIILPHGIAASLTPQQRRWVLLHELAHVRRRDLLVAALQRCASILHFFNPAVWIANRIIHRLREYVCDDLAVSLGQTTAVESGEAFLRILRYDEGSRRSLHGALGVFGLDSRASCFLRIRRLLNIERPIRSAPGAWSRGGVILFALLSLPNLRAAMNATAADSQNAAKESAAPNQRKQEAPTDKGAAKDEQEFELRVVGPDGKPIPEAIVEIRTGPISTTAERIRRGKFIRTERYGAFVATDVDGRLVVELSRAPASFNLYITTPGFGPYWAGWWPERNAEPIPPQFTAQLEASWSVGGIIVDADGKPVAGAKIGPSIEFKKRPGQTQQLGVGTNLKSDATGKWRFDSVPVSMGEVFVGIDHPSYKPVRRQLTRGEFGIERGREPTSKVVLDRGLTVTGTVTDESGKPIAGALLRTKLLNDVREAKTGENGIYRLAGCEPRTARIVVSAKGRATDMKELRIDSEMGPVDFQMKPGGTVRIRVLDLQGKPVPKACIFFQRWRGMFSYFEFGHVSQYADNDGVWVWNEAPLDEFKADICPPDGMELELQPLIARAEEYVFRTSPALVVSGNVIDAVTKKPIKKFRAVPGFRSSDKEMHWTRSEDYTASDGKYRVRRTRSDFDFIRIEADGYQAATSRDIKSNEGTVSIDFELTRGKNVAARVFTPRNLPAVGAVVALGVAGSQINIKNGEIEEPAVYCARDVTDETGRFHFPTQDKDFELVIMHPSGIAHIRSTPDWDLTRIIHLEPWSRVEGTFRIGTTPAANVPISLGTNRLNSSGRNIPSIFTRNETTTGPDGRFVFERVIPGSGRLGRRITLTVDEGATAVTSSCMVAADFPAGKTVHIDLGGTGRLVVGKLRAPDGFNEKVHWNFALIYVQREGAADQRAGPDVSATVDRDGKFRIDDLPEGNYSLSVQFQRDHAGSLSNHPFRVPAAEGDLPADLVDLGTLTLERR